MGVHWDTISIFWPAHVARDGTSYDLSHIDPFSFDVPFAEHNGLPARTVTVHVGFASHAFTCEAYQAGANSDQYPLAREERFFDVERYNWSKRLRQIIFDLPKSKCYFTEGDSFLTVRGDGVPAGMEYRVFFSVRRRDANTVELVVRSAFLGKLETAPRGRRKQPIGFRVILLNTCNGRNIVRPP
jgi:hypothetical protein